MLHAFYSNRTEGCRREPAFARPAALQQTTAHTGATTAASHRHNDSISGGGATAAGYSACISSRQHAPCRTPHHPRAVGRVSCSAEPVPSLRGGDPTAAETEAARRGLASMAQLASAWAQVSSRLGPSTSLDPANGLTEGAAAAAAHQGGLASQGHGAGDGAAAVVEGRHAVDGSGLDGGGERAVGEVPVAWRSAGPSPHQGPRGAGEVWAAPAGVPTSSSSSFAASAGAALVSAPPAPPPSQQQRQHPHPTWAAFAGWQQQEQQQHLHQPSSQLPPQELPQQQGQEQQQQQQKQQQQQHFEAIITALKLALASLQTAPPRPDGRSPATRAVQLASTLADLCAAGLPLDAASMCAGVVAEAADMGALRHDVIAAQLGPGVAGLVHDMLRVRQAPRRIELLDDEGASAVREWCLAFHDVRACVVEVVSWWDELQHMGGLPLFEQQALALEALQIGAPLGHALGLGALSAVMEDACLRVLFPTSYSATSAWLRGLMDPAEDALFAAQQRLLAALDAHPDFGRCAGGLVVKARTKSLFSVMKKLLHLGDLARGGRSREELYDLLGMRAIVKPPDFLPPAEAEAAAAKACYIVQEVACQLWRPIPARSKDYIVAPKPNGYQSLHLTLQLGQLDMDYDTYGVTPPPQLPTETEVPTDSTAPASSSPTPLSSRSQLEASLQSASSSSSSSTSSYDWEAVQLPTSSPLSSPLSYDPRVGHHSEAPGTEAAARGATSDAAAAAAAAEVAAGGPLCLELQIRTTAMDLAAESGDAAHAVYKGGLDARSARQLQAWTLELQRRLAAQPRGRLMLRAAAASAADKEAAEERRRRRRERRAAAAAAAAALAAAQAPPAAAPLGPPTLLAAPCTDFAALDPAAAALAAPASSSTLTEPQAVPSRTAPKSDGGGAGAPSKLMPPPLRRTTAAAATIVHPPSAQARAQTGDVAASPVVGTSGDTPAVPGVAAAGTSTASGHDAAARPTGSNPRAGSGAGRFDGEGTRRPPVAAALRVTRPQGQGQRTQGTDAVRLLPKPSAAAPAAPRAAPALGSRPVLTLPSRRQTPPPTLLTQLRQHGHAEVPTPNRTEPDQPQPPQLPQPPQPSSCNAEPDQPQPAAQGQPPVQMEQQPLHPQQQQRTEGALAAGVAAEAGPPHGQPQLQLTELQLNRPGQSPQSQVQTPLPQPQPLTQQQRLLIFSSLGSMDEVDDPHWPPPLQQHHQQQQQSLNRQQQQQQPALTEQQRLLLFSSLGSIDEVDDPPLVIGLGQSDAAAAAEQLFRHLDVNGDGRLSLGEVRQVLMDLAAPSSDRDAAALMAALDRNGDGGVSMEEFVEGLSRATQQQQQQHQQQGDARQGEREREEAAAAAAAERRGLQGPPTYQPWPFRP